MSEITAFLKARRARLRPEQLGLVGGDGRRRVPGLRREEVASLAGLSVDYYTRFEQGRGMNVSDQVVRAVARALGLTSAETAHLQALARSQRRTVARENRVGAPTEAGGVRRPLRQVVSSYGSSPAFLSDRTTDVLVWNAAAERVFGFGSRDARYRNLARHVFGHPGSRDLYVEWDEVAARFVAWFHSVRALHPEDEALAALVAELSSDHEFRRLWDRHDVHERSNGLKRILSGDGTVLDLRFEALALPDDPSIMLTVFVPSSEESPERRTA
jgi:transcriptional regulator with XRE-family HTH domain